MQKYKTKISVILVVLMLTLSTILVTLVPFSAADWHPGAEAFVSATPKVVGIGQPMFISGWVYPMPSPNGALYGDYTFTITKPDHTTFTINVRSGTEATSGFNWNPDQIGVHNVVMSFPGDPNPANLTGPLTSKPFEFTVQAEPIPYPDYTTLPDHPWSYPISQVNQEWFRITGAWPKNYGNGYSGYTYYSPGPETAHVIWKQAILRGGLLGGDQGHDGIVRADQGGYGEQEIVAALGRMWYVTTGYVGPVGDTGYSLTEPAPLLKCFDQYTGEMLYQVVLPTTDPDTGEVSAAAQRGGGTIQVVLLGIAKGTAATEVSAQGMANGGEFAIWISGGGLWKINPLTGEVIWYTTENLSPTYSEGMWYINNYPERGIFSCISATSDYSTGWPPLSTSFGANQQVEDITIWSANVSETGVSMNAVLEGYVVDQINGPDGTMKLNTWNQYTGELIANGTYGGWYASPASNPCYGNGLYTRLGEDRRTYAWSFETGSLAWVSEPTDWPWGTFGNYQGSAGYGVVIASSYDGYKYCYNATTGETMWKQGTGTDNPYNYEYATNQPQTWGYAILTDGKVYWASGEHTPAAPTQRGDMLYCNDIATGELLWALPYVKGGRSFYGSGAANGMIWYLNQYDGCVYMIGKGATKTTVEVTSDVINYGDNVLIKGRVTDESPGLGVRDVFMPEIPAVSDDSMSTWMAYLYTLGGAEGPWVDLSTVTGVTVTLDVIDSNGNYRTIGTTTADANGFYKLMWEPDIPGEYTVIANFEGSKSYYASCSETAFGVVEVAPGQVIEPEPTTPEPTEPTPTEPTPTEPEPTTPEPTEPEPTTPEPTTPEPTAETPLITTEIAIIAVIAVAAIIGVASYWLLKKRK